ncbi:MAG: hypothetical protein ACTSUW_05420 [Candidatus Heimdallarchaeota archaeon]
MKKSTKYILIIASILAFALSIVFLTKVIPAVVLWIMFGYGLVIVAIIVIIKFLGGGHQDKEKGKRWSDDYERINELLTRKKGLIPLAIGSGDGARFGRRNIPDSLTKEPHAYIAVIANKKLEGGRARAIYSVKLDDIVEFNDDPELFRLISASGNLFYGFKPQEVSYGFGVSEEDEKRYKIDRVFERMERIPLIETAPPIPKKEEETDESNK